MPGKILNRQAQQILLNVVEYFTKERDNNGPLIPLSAVHERVADAMKISRGTVSRIVAKGKLCETTGEPLTSPRKKRPKSKPVRDQVDTFTKDAIRRRIYEMHSKREHITLDNLHKALLDRDTISFSKSTMYQIITEIGFKYKKDDDRRILCERNYVVEQRIAFLRKYKENKGKLNVIFLDETWIFSRGSRRKSWQDESTSSAKNKPAGEGKRYIVPSAGGRNGFVPHSSLIFASKSNTGDYHGEMTAENFNKWLEKQLLPHLEEPSLIVMDNASYHSQLKEKPPSTNWNKLALKEFLTSKNIPFTEEMFKVELYNLAKTHKLEKQYTADAIIMEHGHQVLRLPPYHCQYNAIEQVWSQCKRYFDSHIGRDGFGDDKVKDMWKEALEQVTASQWQNYVTHAADTIEESWRMEYENDIRIEPFIIHVGSDSETDSDCSL